MLDATFTVDNPYKQKQQQQPQQQQPQLHQQRSCGEDSEYYNDEELWRLMDVDECSGADHSANRPNYLDVFGSSGYTVVSRKPMFQFSGKIV